MKKNVKPQKHHIEFDKPVFPKNIQWMHDFDYLATLPPKEAAWMAKFIREYLNGNVKKGDRKALHYRAELRKDCYNRKNLQNNDLMSILNANGKMDRINDTAKHATAKESFRKLTARQRRP